MMRVLAVCWYLFCIVELYGDATWERYTEAEKTAYVQGYIDGVCYLIKSMSVTNPLWYFTPEEVKIMVEKYYMIDKNKLTAIYEAILMAITEAQLK
jgi:hypothetical protein